MALVEKKVLKKNVKPEADDRPKIEYVKVIGRISKKTKKALYQILIEEEISFTKWLQRQAKKYVAERSAE